MMGSMQTLMRTAMALVATALTLTAAPASAQTPPPDVVAKHGEITPAGFLNMRMGMTLRRAARVGNVRFTKVQRSPGSSCAYSSVRNRRVNVMLRRGRIVRFETKGQPPYTKPSRTPGLGNIRVGDAADKVETTFGSAVRRSPHKYVEGGSYLDIAYRAGKYKGQSMRFGTDADDRVITVIGGKTGATRLVEGCS